MRSGAGVVKIALPASIVHDVAPHILESTIFPLSDTTVSCEGRPEEEGGYRNKNEKSLDAQIEYVPEQIEELTANVKTVAFGMGIGTGDGAKKVLEHLLTKFSGNLIVDADGLTLLSTFDKKIIKDSGCTIILTPHIKEFSRLTGLTIEEINNAPTECAKKYAADTGTVVLLKGPSTTVTDGDKVYITDRGCAGMATAGSGDVLSGILAATASYVEDKCIAAAAAAYINGAAGELAGTRYGNISMTAGDTVAAIPEVIMNTAR